MTIQSNHPNPLPVGITAKNVKKSWIKISDIYYLNIITRFTLLHSDEGYVIHDHNGFDCIGEYVSTLRHVKKMADDYFMMYCNAHEVRDGIVRSSKDGWRLVYSAQNNNYSIQHSRTYEESMSIEFSDVLDGKNAYIIPTLKRIKVAEFNALCAKYVVLRKD